MKKTLLLLCSFALVTLAAAQTTCHRDSNLLITHTIVSPAPWTPDSMYYNLHPACINDPYNQSVTFNIPDTVTVPSIPTPIVLNSISLATSGAITGLPAGVTYNCDPPNCIFNHHTLGCLLLYGTPTPPGPANLPDTTELKITVSISSPSFPFPIPITFPGTVAPNNHFYMITRAQGQCASGTHDLNSQILFAQNAPNPFSGFTTITVESAVTANFKFEVFNTLGQTVYIDEVKLVTGENKFTFDAGKLPNGAYYYTIGNAAGKISRKMVISR
jgi:hypothetical protein